MSLGTGFIIDSTGLILTNNHVVAEAEEIKIIFTEDEDEKPTDGQVVGRDPELDLALIRVKTNRQLVPLPLGDSDTLEVGEYVMAVGNPFGQGHSVTHGIISAKQRRAPDFQLANYLQTDAPINPGNSGGPLVNLKGEVIGINNAIHQGAQGIGFAIPISLVKTVLPQLRSKGSVSRGYIGVGIQELTPQITTKLNLPKNLRGPIVTEIRPGEPADKAGLKPYDVILEFNGKPVKNGAELVSKVTATGIDQSVPIKVWRKGGEQNLTIKISQRPNGQQAANKEPKKNKKDPKKAHVDTGMEVETLDSQTKKELGMKDSATGIVVTNVAYGGAADRSGLMRGDVIIEVDTKTIKDEDDFYSVVKEKKSYLLRVRRVDPRGTEVFQVVVLDFNKK
jgi:serine protease Do